MSNKLSHLTEEELNNLIERYYNKEKVSDLIKEFNISLRPSQLVKHFPPETTKTKCEYCGVNLIKPRRSRDYYSWNDNEEGVCPVCGHENTSFCSCPNCTEIEVLKQEKQRQEKQEILDILLFIDEDKKIDFNSLTFIEKVYLGAFLREGISEDYNYIKPISDFINPLAPTTEFQSEIIHHLVDKNIILIHPSTDSEFIEIIDEDKGEFRYYPYEVKWYLNIKKENTNKVPLIESIINPKKIESENIEDAFLLWKKIALNETLEYFTHSINNILGIKYNVGDKTINVFKDLLNDYSVSQIYGIIYKSTNNALRFQAERGVSRKHSANTIIGNAQSYGERAKVNKWELIKYNRIKECPESALSKFFFERIIKIGYNGFNEIPKKEMIKIK